MAGAMCVAVGGKMVRVTLTVKCWNCGREEKIVALVEDSVIDFNCDKLCPACPSVWMTKKELTTKRIP